MGSQWSCAIAIGIIDNDNDGSNQRGSARNSLTLWEAFMMLSVNNGQCGLCSHFGEDHGTDPKLVQIRQSHTAPDDMLDDCAHPRHASLHLKVTPISGCDGFEPAARGAKAN